MGLFDEAMSLAKGQLAEGAEGNSGVLDAVMGLINNPQSGRLSGLIAQLSQAGLAPDMLSSGLAQILPGIIDKLTPNGEVP